MKFTLYLDAVRYCRYNKLPCSRITKHGALWKCHWTVDNDNEKPTPTKTKKQVRST